MALNIVSDIDRAVKVRHVLASVSDKTGLESLIPGLVAVNPDVKIYSTGGTYAALEKLLGAGGAAHNLVAVSDYTGQPEMQGGLVKTLDFKIYLGLLSETYNAAHRRDLARTGAVAMDMVVVNLYPFGKTVAQAGVTPEQARTNIDIGGPCMVRAAAKNYLRVAAVTDPADYAAILDELQTNGGTIALQTRFALACKAFAHTAAYDRAIAGYFAGLGAADVAACYAVHETALAPGRDAQVD
jgi:phosphoribosylaminoimidazolecarboxamide formyltransferase / IMP cyclohydrolase